MGDLSDDLDSTDRSKLSEDRLAWLAVRDYVSSRCRPSFLLRLLGATSGGGGMRAAREVASDKVHSYAFAVADAAELVCAPKSGVEYAWLLRRAVRRPSDMEPSLTCRP